MSAEAFAGLRPILEQRWKAQWKAAGFDEARTPRIAGERIGPFDAQGPYDPAFLEASFALPREGTASGPVRTGFGWHLIYLAELLPPRSATFEEAIPEIVERGRLQLESQRAAELVGAALSGRDVRSHPERLQLTQSGPREAPRP